MQQSFQFITDDDDVSDSNDDHEILKKYSAITERKLPQSFDKNLSKITSETGKHSETDSSDSEVQNPNEYDPREYENLDVSPEIKQIFQFVTKYTPQEMALDYKFKPFVPEFLPAVGDIDAFLKVIPPNLLGDEECCINQELGLVVLDEPAANQSDAALLHLQLRAESVKTTQDSNVVVKTVDNVEKNAKTIEKWIKDISVLHKSKSFPVVKYSEQMPDLDELMQEWSEEMEEQMKNGFPEPTGTLTEYIEEICSIVQIPSTNKIEALHLLFSLYAAVRSSHLFKNSQLDKENVNLADQLVLD